MEDLGTRASDAAVAATVDRRLRAYAGRGRWSVHVHAGAVLLCDDYDEPVQQHVAAMVAGAVPGVRQVDTTLRSRCPHHRLTGTPDTASTGPSALAPDPPLPDDGVDGREQEPVGGDGGGSWSGPARTPRTSGSVA